MISLYGAGRRGLRPLQDSRLLYHIAVGF